MQVSQLGAAAQKYQAATQNASPNLSVPELQNNCNMYVLYPLSSLHLSLYQPYYTLEISS